MTLAVILVVLAWSGFAAWQLSRAYADIRAGRDIMDRASGRLSAEHLDSKILASELDAARIRFEHGHRRVGSPLLAPIKFIPIVGRQLRSVEALSGAATVVTRAGSSAAHETNVLLELPHGPGPGRVALIHQLAGVLHRVDTQVRHLDLGPSHALIGPLASARALLSKKLGDVQTNIRDGLVGTEAAADLFAGPRRYLLLAANNSEMRAGSGMLLNAGLLETSGGTVRLVSMHPITDIQVAPGKVTLKGDLASRWGWLVPHREWRNLLLSPRFDASAQLASEMWVAAGNNPVDGVIVIDPLVLRGILAVTGPIDAGGQRLNASNVVEELLFGQYARHPGTRGLADRREELGEIAKATFDALNSRNWSATNLARQIAGPALGRHFLIWSRHATEQRAWRAAHVDGSLPSNALMVSVLNRGGNKMDHFLKVDTQLDLRKGSRGTEATVRVQVRNVAPMNLPEYVMGPYPGGGLPAGAYLGIATLNFPKSGKLESITGGQQLPNEGPDGSTQMAASTIQLGRGQEEVVTFRFQLRQQRGSLAIQPSARIPPIRWTVVKESFTDDRARIVRW